MKKMIFAGMMAAVLAAGGGVSVNAQALTMEELKESLALKIDTNGLVYDVCINKEDLLGEPQIGRRFKGNIWMQGCIRYMN